MVIPDINVLIYAYDSRSRFHPKASEWWSELLSGTEPVGLPNIVAFGFLRVITNPKVFASPLGVNEAVEIVHSWISQPCVEILPLGKSDLVEALVLLEEVGTIGNLVMDAQLAAITTSRGAVLSTCDSDFLRFAGLSWFNPITGQSSKRLGR